MARDFNGSSDIISVASALVTAMPLTFAAWFNSDHGTNAQTIISISDTGDVSDHFDMTLSGGNVLAEKKGAGATTSAASSTTYSTGTWTHACAVYTSATLCAAYLNGANKGTQTTSITPTAANLDTSSIGALKRTSTIFFMDGRIMEAGIWNVALDDDEVAALGKGFSPLCVRPHALIAYVPLVREIIDRKGTAWTATGTAVADHGRVIYPKRSSARRFTTAVAAGRASKNMRSAEGMLRMTHAGSRLRGTAE